MKDANSTAAQYFARRNIEPNKFEPRAFSMFQFSPVGGVVALGGVAFVALVGWRLIRKDRLKKAGAEELFALNEYITEVRVPEECKFVGMTLGEVEKATGEKLMVFGFIRKDGKVIAPNRNNLVREESRYLVKADPVDLKNIMDEFGLRLDKELRARIDNLEGKDVTFAEAVVTPTSRMLGRTRAYLRRRTSNTVVLMAVARQGRPMRKRLGDIRFQVGDVAGGDVGEEVTGSGPDDLVLEQGRDVEQPGGAAQGVVLGFCRGAVAAYRQETCPLLPLVAFAQGCGACVEGAGDGHGRRRLAISQPRDKRESRSRRSSGPTSRNACAASW